jgi:hypothetical protein
MALRHRLSKPNVALHGPPELRLPDHLSTTLKGTLRRKFYDIVNRDSAINDEADDLHDLQRQLLESLAQYGPEPLAEIVDACGLSPAVKLSRDRMTSGLASPSGRPEMPTEDLWEASLSVLFDLIREDPHKFSRGMVDASKRPALRAFQTELEGLGKTSVSGTVRSLLEPLPTDDRRAIVQDLLHEPASTLADPARRMLLEWGAHLVASPLESLKPAAQRLADASEPHFPDLHNPEYLANQSSIAISIALSWASAGFPTLQPTHKLAASLMATYMPPDLLPALKMPWRTFAIAIPDGILPPIQEPGDKPLTPCLAGLIDMPQGLSLWVAFGQFGMINVQPLPRGLRDLIDGSHLTDETVGYSPQDRRVFELIGRLVLGCLVEIDQPAHRGDIGRGSPKRPASGRTGDLPSAWTFILRRDVRVDLRQWARAFASGEHKGTSPGVQILVRGHHKRQPHGPKGQLRKWIHVEPYWRGDDALPIAIRSHKIID